MKRARRKRNSNNNSLQDRRGEEEAAGRALPSEDRECTFEEHVVERSTRGPNVETFDRKTEEGAGYRTQSSTTHKGTRNTLAPSAETLLTRQKFEESLRRGLLQSAANNTALPGWLLKRKSYDRVGEFYVRLKAELVAPEQRDHAKIKRMLAELHSSQQHDITQHDEPNDTAPG
jgi:hypothetical protein